MTPPRVFHFPWERLGGGPDPPPGFSLSPGGGFGGFLFAPPPPEAKRARPYRQIAIIKPHGNLWIVGTWQSHHATYIARSRPKHAAMKAVPTRIVSRLFFIDMCLSSLFALYLQEKERGVARRSIGKDEALSIARTRHSDRFNSGSISPVHTYAAAKCWLKPPSSMK